MPMEGRPISRIDSPDFFISPKGNRDPVIEGEATIRSFFQSSAATQGNIDMQCLYPARYHWLKKRLAFDPSLLPEQACPQLTHWMEAMDPASVTLVFPESYLNNPASMFGHTFLRIEQNRARPVLLAPSINFAAITEEKPGIGYALKGLFGGYTGRFSDGLYVDQVRAYGALENRDIYEYHLGMTAVETEFLLLHVWELKRAGFDYYFVDENCSYQLLALLEVANPSLELTAKVEYTAIPVETIRILTEIPGLLSGVTYRPSRLNLLRAKTAHLSTDEVEMMNLLSEGGSVESSSQWQRLSDNDKAAILEAAIDKYLYEEAVATGKNVGDSPGYLELLQARSRLKVPPQPVAVPGPAVRPDQGHGTSRITMGTGTDAERFFIELGFRPVLHDLLDPGPGYMDGAQVEFFNTRLRYIPDREQVRIQQLDLLHILSFPPMDALTTPISWAARIGATQIRFADDADHTTGMAMAGFGLSSRLAKDLQGYFIMTGEMMAGDRFDYGMNAGIGAEACMRGAGSDDRFGFILQAKAVRTFVQPQRWTWSLRYRQALQISPDFSLRLGVSREQEFAVPNTEMVFSLNWYF